MFIVMVNYIKPIEIVDEFLKPHNEYLDKYYSNKKFIFSGRRNPRVGGIIVSGVSSSEEIEAIIKEDPFYKHSIAEYEFIDLTPTKWDAALDFLLENHH